MHDHWKQRKRRVSRVSDVVQQAWAVWRNGPVVMDPASRPAAAWSSDGPNSVAGRFEVDEEAVDAMFEEGI